MIGDVVTVLWKESKEILAMGGGGVRGRIQFLFLIGAFGIFMPLSLGSRWVTSPLAILMVGWFPLILVSVTIADSFAGERERHTLETLLASRLSDVSVLVGKMAAAVGYAWGITLLCLLVGVVTVNIADWTGGFLFYSGVTTLGTVLLSFLVALLASASGVLVSLRAETVRQANQTLGVATMVVFFLPVVGIQSMPDAMRQSLATWAMQAGTLNLVLVAALVLAVIDIALIAAAKKRFQRTKLTVG